jgi:hypothetical protein
MFHKDLFKDWLSSHFLDCGWYLECPKDCTPPLKIFLHEKIGLRFQSGLQVSLTALVEASKKEIGGRGKSRLKRLKTFWTRWGNMSRFVYMGVFHMCKSPLKVF